MFLSLSTKGFKAKTFFSWEDISENVTSYDNEAYSENQDRLYLQKCTLNSTYVTQHIEMDQLN